MSAPEWEERPEEDLAYFAERGAAWRAGRQAIREFEEENRGWLAALGIVPAAVTRAENSAPAPGWNFGSGLGGGRMSAWVKRLFWRWVCLRCDRFSWLCRRGSHVCGRCIGGGL